MSKSKHSLPVLNALFHIGLLSRQVKLWIKLIHAYQKSLKKKQKIVNQNQKYQSVKIAIIKELRLKHG